MEYGLKDALCFSDALNVCEISILSGKRPCGRTVVLESGRRNNGFLYIREGKAAFFDGNGEICSACTGELVFLPKGKQYRTTYVATMTDFSLVNFELLDRQGNSCIQRDEISVIANDNQIPGLAEIMRRLEQNSLSVNRASVWRRKALCCHLLAAVSEYLEQPSEKDTMLRITDGVRLLQQTYLDNLPIAEYAKASRISVNRFRELFHSQFGVSPVKYRNRLRIGRAKELLGEEGLTISEVAYASGFENLGYFYRTYQLETGESPAETKAKTKP